VCRTEYKTWLPRRRWRNYYKRYRYRLKRDMRARARQRRLQSLFIITVYGSWTPHRVVVALLGAMQEGVTEHGINFGMYDWQA
jgi:hypothetical protein